MTHLIISALVCLIIITWFILLILDSKYGTCEYRIVTNGSKYKVQYRSISFPIWGDVGIINNHYDTKEEAQGAVSYRKAADEKERQRRKDSWSPVE
jgi:hypothetical protein